GSAAIRGRKALGDGDEKEGEGEGFNGAPRIWQKAVEMEETEGESQRNGYGRVEEELAPADAQVARAQAKVESDSVELADAEKGVETGVEQKDFIERSKTRRPRRLEPAEIDGEAENREHEKVAPVGALVGVGATCAVEENRDDDGKQRIERQPAPFEDVRGARNE